jgi:hypothetical protein
VYRTGWGRARSTLVLLNIAAEVPPWEIVFMVVVVVVYR